MVWDGRRNRGNDGRLSSKFPTVGNLGKERMIIYHFCCERDMRGIRNKGITKGGVVCERSYRQNGKIRYQPVIVNGFQWVTLDEDRNRQSWATQILLRYDRTEYRWTVEIPEKEEGQLYDRDRLAALYPGSEQAFDGWAGSENWRVFRGNIPKFWLKKLERWNKETDAWEEVQR